MRRGPGLRLRPGPVEDEAPGECAEKAVAPGPAAACGLGRPSDRRAGAPVLTFLTVRIVLPGPLGRWNGAALLWGDGMAMYTLFFCRSDGSTTSFEAFELAGDREANARALALLAEHPSCAYVSAFEGERLALARHRGEAERGRPATRNPHPDRGASAEFGAPAPSARRQGPEEDHRG